MAFSLLAVMLVLCLGGLPSAMAKNLTKTLLVDDVQTTGAMCLDGSPAGYYIRRGSGEGARKYILYLQGGGWCFSLEDCYKRSKTDLGSSKNWPESEEEGGFHSDDPAVNPDFYNWTFVILKYCDGASFSGDQDEPAVFNGTKVYFRGYRNLKALIKHLNENEGMSQATNVILTGSSAGGLAVYLHVDFVKTMLSQNIQDYRALPDAGYFIEIADVNGTNEFLEDSKNMMKLQNINEAIIPACRAKYGETALWKCIFAPEIYIFIQTPLFVLNSKVDSAVLNGHYGQPCMPPNCTKKGEEDLKNYERVFMEQIQPVLNSPMTNGYFLDTCFTHVQSKSDSWDEHAINGVTIAASFGDWYFNRSQKTRLMDCDDYPCNPTCTKRDKMSKAVHGSQLLKDD